jgi:hypothetical protein
MSNLPTVRVKAPDGDGFVVINAVDFDHDEHELFDKKDKALVPERSKKVVAAESADVEDLRKQLGEAQNRATEAESERDEMKARAEAAEAKLSGDKPKGK